MNKNTFRRSCYLILMCIGFINACSDTDLNTEQAQFDNVQVFEPVRQITSFDFMSNQTNNFSLDSLKSHWSIIFLGYTYCPDICPTTLTDLSRIYPALKAKIPEAQVIFISADPKRDTQSQLTEYTRFFNPEFIAATAPHSDLLPFTRELGLVYSLSGEGDNYLVNHSASLVVVNPDGNLVARVKPDFASQPAKIDYEQLVKLIVHLDSKYKKHL